jgi:hypothetical protein
VREEGSKNLRIQWTVKLIKKLVEIEKKRGKEVSKRRDIEIENTKDVAEKEVDQADWSPRCRQVLGNVNLETLL